MTVYGPDGLRWDSYRAYTASDTWRLRARDRKAAAGDDCEVCQQLGGEAHAPLDAHHITYARVGREDSMNDLLVLCRFHHCIAEAIERAMTARWGAGCDRSPSRRRCPERGRCGCDLWLTQSEIIEQALVDPDVHRLLAEGVEARFPGHRLLPARDLFAHFGGMVVTRPSGELAAVSTGGLLFAPRRAA